MENAYRHNRLVKAIRWLAVIPLALAIQLIFAFALITPMNTLPVNRERLSFFVFGVGELLCVGIASFISAWVAPNHRVFAALLGGGSILLINLLSLFESIRIGSFDQDYGSAEIIVLGVVGAALAGGAWYALDRSRKLRADSPRV